MRDNLVLDPRAAARVLLADGFADYAVVAALIDNHDLAVEDAEAVVRDALAGRPCR
jgi:hypothetical protein